MMTDGLRAGGGLAFEDRGEGGEMEMILVEEVAPGEWGWEPELLGRWKFTVRGERPGVGGRAGRLLWGERVWSWVVRLLGYGSFPPCLGEAPTLPVRWRVQLLSDKSPEVSGRSCTLGGDWLLLWCSPLRVPDKYPVSGWFAGSDSLWCVKPTVVSLELEPEL